MVLINSDDANRPVLAFIAEVEMGDETMLGKVLIWVVAVAGVLAAGVPDAYANEQEIVDRWTVELREAQKHCDAGRYRAAKRELLAGIDAQIDTVDRYLGYISDSSAEERVRDQRLGVQLILDRQRLTSKRAMYAAEKFVPCDENAAASTDYQKVCDAYGAGFFYIPGTDTCLRLSDTVERRAARIADPVRYEFSWGGTPGEDGGELPLSNGAAFWDFGASFEPSLSFGGMQTRGAFSTETPTPELVVPGYHFDTSFQGSSIKGELFGSLSIGGFPVTLNGGIEFDNASAAASASNVAFPEGFGIPGVGPVNGAFVNSPTDMLQFDFTAQRQQISAFFEAGFPISEGQFVLAEMTAGYRLGGLVGLRGGSFSQHEMTTAVTSSPAFPTPGATSTYETDFTGGFGGLYAGLSLDKNIPFGDDGLSVQEMFSFAAGYDMYRLDVTDRVVANGLGGALALNDTNSFSHSGGIPTVKLDASIGIGTASWMLGVHTGLTLGKTALIDYQRLNDGGNPHTNLLPELGYTLGVSITARF